MKKNHTNNYVKFVEENEEVRCGFKISVNRKKVWNIQLGLLEELKKICEKYNIKYYASGGTMLGAIRHKGYIPWDDDMDFIMFREDYEKLFEVAPKELPKYMKIWENHSGFARISNTNTAVFGDDNWRDKDFNGGICIDIFPIDYASRLMVINHVKSTILRFLRLIMFSQKSSGFINNKLGKGKKNIAYICNFIFGKIDYSKIHNIHEKISKTVFFKGKNIYTGRCPWLYYPKNIFNKSHNMKFESTSICIPDGYDTYLKTQYGDYMKPVIRKGGHRCWYSVDKSYKDIIKVFDKSKSNEENYNNCEYLFVI